MSWITVAQVKLIVKWGKCVCVRGFENVETFGVFKGKRLQREEMDSDED